MARSLDFNLSFSVSLRVSFEERRIAAHYLGLSLQCLLARHATTASLGFVAKPTHLLNFYVYRLTAQSECMQFMSSGTQ